MQLKQKREGLIRHLQMRRAYWNRLKWSPFTNEWSSRKFDK